MPRRNKIEFLLQVRDQATKQLKGFSAAISSVRAQLIALGAVTAGIQIAKGVLDASIAFEKIQRSLKFVTGSTEEARKEFEFIRRESDRLGLNLRSVAQDYGKLSAAAKGTELQGQGTRDIFLGIVEAGRVLGLQSVQVERSLRAVEQIISKGRVSAEELRQQLGEQLPGAFQIAARSIGVTTEQLDKMLEAGELTASELLPKLGAELREIFADDVEDAADDTVASIERFKNAIFELQLEIAEGGVLDAMTLLIKGATDVTKAFDRFISPSLSEEIEDTTKKIINLKKIIQGNEFVFPFLERVQASRELEREEKKLDELLLKQGQLNAGTGRKSTNQAQRDFLVGSNALFNIIGEQDKAEQKALEKQAKQNARAAASIFEQTRTPIEAFIISMKEARMLLNEGLIDPEVFNRYRQILLESVVDPVDNLKENTQETFDFMREAAIQAVRNIESAFAEFYKNIGSGSRQMAADFVRALRDMIAEYLAFKTVTGIGRLIGLDDAFFSSRSAGGPASGLTMVGERGPELVDLPRGSRVVPNSAMGGRGGNMQFTTNIDARGADPGLIARLPQIMEQRDKRLMLAMKRFIETGTIPI